MSDEARQFSLAGRAGDYTLLPDVSENIQYESDGSDCSRTPSGPDKLGSPGHSIHGTSLHLLALERALVPQNHLNDMFDASAHITGDDASTYASPSDRVAPGRSIKDVQEDRDNWLVSIGFDPAYHPPEGGGPLDIYTDASPFPDHIEAERTFHEEQHRRSISAAVDRMPVNDVTFPMIRLTRLADTDYISRRHEMLLQLSLAAPGFHPRPLYHGAYTYDGGVQRPYRVYVPYQHRRLWLTLLWTSTPGNNPHPVVSGRLVLLFAAALCLHDQSRHSIRSLAFARLVLDFLQQRDHAFRTLGTEADIQFALQCFSDARLRYRVARERDVQTGARVWPVYMDGVGQEAPHGSVFRQAQEAADWWFAAVWREDMAEEQGMAAGPAVEREHSRESDGEIAPFGEAVFEEMERPPGYAPRFAHGPRHLDSDRSGGNDGDSDCSDDSDSDGSEVSSPEGGRRPVDLDAVQYPDHYPRRSLGFDLRDDNFIDRGARRPTARRQSV